MASVYCAVRTGSLYIILRSADTVYLCVLCGSENKQRLFPYSTLTDWFYNRDGECLLRGTDWMFKCNTNYSYGTWTSCDQPFWHKLFPSYQDANAPFSHSHNLNGSSVSEWNNYFNYVILQLTRNQKPEAFNSNHYNFHVSEDTTLILLLS